MVSSSQFIATLAGGAAGSVELTPVQLGAEAVEAVELTLLVLRLVHQLVLVCSVLVAFHLPFPGGRGVSRVARERAHLQVGPLLTESRHLLRG